MKLKLIVPFALLLISGASFGQISLGGQAGAVFSKPSTTLPTSIPELSYDVNSRTSFSAGLIADIPFGESGFRLMPELNYVNKGYKVDASFDLIGQQIKAEAKSNIAYIDLPINFAYAITLGNNRLMVGAGPYAGFGISGKSEGTSTINGVSQKQEENIEFGSGSGQFDRLDVGANFMAAYVMNNGLMFKVNYGLGLVNLSNDSDYDYKNRSLGVSVGYFFLQGGK